MFEIAGDRTTREAAHGAASPTAAYEPYLVSETEAGPPDLSQARIISRIPWRRRPAFWLAALGLGLAIGAAEEWVRRAGPPPELGRLARTLGFGIEQVTLAGHRFTFDRDIFDVLDLDNVRTFAALDTTAVKARIERLPWIDTAELSRVFPGRLDIRVTERKPFAVWLRDGRHHLIDKTGRVLGAVSGTSLPPLPRFSGEGAAAGSAEILATLARYPAMAGRIAEIERVSERRWRLRLDNVTTVELPADGEVAALEELAHDADLARIVASGNVTLDFRGPGRVAIRPQAPPAPAAPLGTGS